MTMYLFLLIYGDLEVVWWRGTMEVGRGSPASLGCGVGPEERCQNDTSGKRVHTKAAVRRGSSRRSWRRFLQCGRRKKRSEGLSSVAGPTGTDYREMDRKEKN